MGLTVNYRKNLISLKLSLHKHLHYEVYYYYYVNDVVLKFQKVGRGTSRQRLDDALTILRAFLSILDQAAPG